jgi:hypothetical protein
MGSINLSHVSGQSCTTRTPSIARRKGVVR